MTKDLTKKHILDFHRWISNKSAVEFSSFSFQTERDINWVKQYVTKIINDDSCWNQAIVIDGIAVGYCGLSNISQQNCNAEYFILIGNDRFWKKGKGRMRESCHRNGKYHHKTIMGILSDECPNHYAAKLQSRPLKNALCIGMKR